MTKKKLHKKLKEVKSERDEYLENINIDRNEWGLRHNSINEIDSILITSETAQTKIRLIAQVLSILKVQLIKLSV